jgi:hypothetical protein
MCISKTPPLDNGQLPFAAGHFWDNSDIVVKNIDDGIFEHQSAIKGRDNYIYVRVTNLGPATARNVNVRVVAVPFPGTEFVFPADWAGFTPTYILPVSMVSHFPSIDSIHSTLVHSEPTVWAKFKLDSSQVDKLYGWETDKRWHPCLLAQVSSDNDYCSPSAGMHSWESNNLAQRNISIINIVYEKGGISSAPRFPFLTGNKLNMDLYMEIVVDRSALPKQAEVLLDPYDTDEYFSALEKPETTEFNPNASIKFLDRTRLLLSRPNFKGILTLEAGSVFQEVGKHEDNITIISQQDAEWVIHSGRRLIAIHGENATIGVQKQPEELRQMSLAFKIHEKVKLKDQYQVSVSQRNTKGQVVGGVTILVNVQGD